jgi:tRNA(Ile)-lysidine synthase
LSPKVPSHNASDSPWLEQIRGATSSYPRDELYLVGVSGGLDSRVLLHLLLLIGFKRLIVCHLNHNLRGDESSADSRFVCGLCHRLHLETYIEKLTELPDAGSLETSARLARWEFFVRAANKFGTGKIFLGHHADDQVETFLFNLFRGSASFENAAMSPESRVRISETNLLLLRPLLQISKEDLRLYAARHRLRFREDSSNQSREMTRNRIRHDLIPAIELVLGRSIRSTILRTIEVATGEAEFIRFHVPPMDAQVELKVSELRPLPLAIQRLVIHSWLKAKQVKQCGFEEVEKVRSLLANTKIAKVNLPGNAFCRRRSGVLFLQE